MCRLIPPLPIEEVHGLEAPCRDRSKLAASGKWQSFSALPGPRRALTTFGPRLPTSRERRLLHPSDSVSEDVLPNPPKYLLYRVLEP